MNPLSPTERKALKARAHHLDPVVMIGDAGLTAAVIHEIEVALKSHELIKVRVAGDDRELRKALVDDICRQADAAAVQHIGKLLVFFRPRPAETARTVKPRRPSGPRRTKKQLGSRITQSARR